MSDFFFDLGLFSLKTLILALCIAGGIIAVLIVAARNKKSQDSIEITDVSKNIEEQKSQVRREIGSAEELQILKKDAKKEKKKNKKATRKPRTFVLEFAGDVKASQVESLRKLVSTVISVADPAQDDVLVAIESPGGMVHGYGLAASQLLRLRDGGFNVTASVDKVAASGGYLMACVAHQIIAAPFAVLGSIGVVAQVPNLHRLLKKNDIDYEEMTSGEYKRTVSVLGEITPEKRQHFEEKLTDTHTLFKDFVKTYRPNLDLAKVGNGDHWYGSEALELGLIDDIQTSDDWILKRAPQRQIIKLSMVEKKNLGQKLSEAVQMGLEGVIDRISQRSFQ